MAVFTNKDRRMRRHLRIRKKVAGTAERPRFCVSVTTNHIYCQFIDDVKGATLASVSTLDAAFKAADGRPNLDGAALLGKMAAERALAANVTEVVFDRSGFQYHGRVKAIAEAARANGLKF
ncbi:50S ribosomal protein L18 [Victivallis sp. Marseille-Q1083]|uniref:50S ribosomal protein L18 n=1 Tax=Victivallis sp. Marseille-Q1083 TaxID=2717288 RepID=UPI00158A9D76|nr:50S ribosomal protein L18 [Victivallis sp. Marseille-Q1083]